MQPVIRRARAGDQENIVRLVRSDRLNPNDLDWPRFVVAAGERGLVGAVQLRHHADGAHELSSLIVRPDARGQRLAQRMIDALLAAHGGPAWMITDAAFADHYGRWGFSPLDCRAAPRSIRWAYRMGRLARIVTFLRGLPPKRLVVLARAEAPMPALGRVPTPTQMDA